MNIRDQWRSFYGDKVPVAYLLRERIHHLWFRIHSLPKSQRYAQSEAETREILRRYNLIANTVLKQEKCALFFPEHALEKFAGVFKEFSAELFCHIKEEDLEISQMAALTVWQSEKFERILRLVADDEIRFLSLMNLQSGEIFAPYDGGADLFLKTYQQRDQLRAQFGDWLSSHPKGL